MEKFLLAPLLSGKELHVVYKQNVCISITFSEICDFIFAQGVYVFVYKSLRRQVYYAGVVAVFQHKLGNRMH